MKPITLASKIFVFLVDSFGMNVDIQPMPNLTDKLTATDGEGNKYEITIAFLGNVSNTSKVNDFKLNRLDFTESIHKNGRFNSY